MDDEKLKEIEEINKGRIFEQIEQMSEGQVNIILLSKKVTKHTGFDGDLPDIGATLRNKLTKVQHEFENAGLSLYVEKLPNSDYGKDPILGRAIIDDLIDYMKRANMPLYCFGDTMNKVKDRIEKEQKEKEEKEKALEKANPITKFFYKVRSIFMPKVKESETGTQGETYTQEEKQEINDDLSEALKLDRELWSYELKDNVVSSLVKYISEREKCKANAVPRLVEKKVSPGLIKLGLEDLIPELKEALVEAYKKKWESLGKFVISEDSMHFFVPDFNRTNPANAGDARKKFEEELKNKASKVNSENNGEKPDINTRKYSSKRK